MRRSYIHSHGNDERCDTIVEGIYKLMHIIIKSGAGLLAVYWPLFIEMQLQQLCPSFVYCYSIAYAFFLLICIKWQWIIIRIWRCKATVYVNQWRKLIWRKYYGTLRSLCCTATEIIDESCVIWSYISYLGLDPFHFL